jgi:hypothetical protein
MIRDHAVEALNQVHHRVLKAGARSTITWLTDDHRPHITATLPIAGRDEPAAMALAMDAGVVNLRTYEGLVSGIAVIDDTWAPGPVDVHVLVNYGSPPQTPVAGIPAQRTGDAETIHDLDEPLDVDDLAHDRDDALYDEVRDARLDHLEHGVEL